MIRGCECSVPATCSTLSCDGAVSARMRRFQLMANGVGNPAPNTRYIRKFRNARRNYPWDDDETPLCKSDQDHFAHRFWSVTTSKRVAMACRFAPVIKSLFLFHTGSNAGFAIAPLESLFCSVGLELGAGVPENVHLAYTDLRRGRPTSIAANVGNIIAHDFYDESAENIVQLARYVANHQIGLVLFFDVQPVSRIFRPLRQAGAKTILTYWGAPISSMNPWWKLTLKRLQFALSNSKIDGMIFESRAMADLAIQGRGVPSELIDIVPLGIDLDLFRPMNSRYVHEQFGFPLERRVVIYSGHMEQRKGVQTLVQAAIDLLVHRRRQDVCFLICGNRNEEEVRDYREMYAGMGIESLIRFAGYRSDLPKIYPSCYCGVIPSTGWDSFPRTALEMAATRLPVVASRLQGLPEAVLDRKTGLLYEPGNAGALADSLELLLDDPATAAEYGENGRKRCETELNLEKQRERFLSVVRKRVQKS
jgi:glycosyltransferase involved in cell wall biosynthesis